MAAMIPEGGPGYYVIVATQKDQPQEEQQAETDQEKHARECPVCRAQKRGAM